jgi:Cation transporter/ATPase, N-terminus
MADLRTGQASLEAPPVAAPAEGLRPADAAELLGRYGPNELPTPRRDPWVRRLARQLMEPMALLLWPPGRVVFDTVRLDPRAWSLAGLLAVAPAALMLLARRLRRGGQGP